MDDYVVTFSGPCTCDHDEEDHGWGMCDMVLDGGDDCPCEAGWEE